MERLLIGLSLIEKKRCSLTASNFGLGFEIALNVAKCSYRLPAEPGRRLPLVEELPVCLVLPCH